MGRVLGGIVGGVGSLIGGRRRARRERRAAAEAEARFQQGLDFAQNESGLSTFSQNGQGANNLIASLLGAGGDPSSGRAAFDNFLNSTGFQFQLNEGINAINSNAAARGKLNSGATLEATQRLGNDLARQNFSNFIGQLGGLSGQGAAASGQLASIATGTAAGQAGAVQSGGNAAAASRSNGVNAALGGFGNAFGALTERFGI